MIKTYYTTSQAAQLLAVSSDTVLKWVRQGKITSYRTPGGHARIPRHAVETMLPAHEEVAGPEVVETPYRYCWEFYSLNGAVNQKCEECVVFRSRARRCYEMRDIPEQFGNLKLHCTTACEQCQYFNSVHGEGTSVLILTRNRHLREALQREAGDSDVPVRFASSEYECGALLNEYRPDYIVLDCALGQSHIRDLCRQLSRDERIPFTKIILTSKSEQVKDCFEGRIFGWIRKPFSFLQLRCCLGQAE